MTTVARPWATRVKLSDRSYAIGEQARTFSTARITRIVHTGHDVTEVVKVVSRLIS
jgi:hypothetical protein